MDRPEAHHIDWLDGLRAIAVLIVIASHYWGGGIIPGGFGVTIFFVLSGYLITRLLLKEHERFERIDLPRFYGRRFLRLMPELFAYLLLFGVILAPLLGETGDPMQLISGAFYFANYYNLAVPRCDSCINTDHLWSLAVEEHFYLAFPALVLLCAARRARLALILGLVLLTCLVWRMVAFRIGLSETYIFWATDTRLDSIASGCLLAIAQRQGSAVVAAFEKRGLALFALGLNLILVSFLWRSPDFRVTFRFTMQGIGLFLLFGTLLWSDRARPLTKLLGLGAMAWMGRMSYAAYLWHLAAKTMVSRAAGTSSNWEMLPVSSRLVQSAAGVILTFAIAYASYRLIYKPLQVLKPRLVPRGAEVRPRPADRPAA